MKVLDRLLASRPFELKKKEEDDDEQLGFYKCPRITVAVYFTYFAERVICLKRPGTSEPLLLLRLNGHVGPIPTCRVYRLSDI